MIEKKTTFARELEEWSRTGKPPSSGSQDIHDYLNLQYERLKERGLRMECDLLPPRSEIVGTSPVMSRSSKKSTKYESYMDFRPYERRLRFYKGNRKKYSKRTQEVLYTKTTHLKNEEVMGAEPYTCPSCGAISTIAQLQQGCAYCDAHFLMTDLFPKVTDYFYLRNVAQSNDHIKSSIAKCVLVVGLVFMAVVGFMNRDLEIWQLIPYLLGGFLAGMFFGYLFWAFGKLFWLFVQAIGSVPSIVSLTTAKRKISNLLYGFDHTFCYEYFVNEMVSTLKMIIFAKDRGNLVVYEGNQDLSELDHIIEASYNSVLELQDYKVQNGYCVLNLEIHMLDIHDHGWRICEKRDVFQVQVCKNVSVPEDAGFSVKKVQCQSCGGNFDATRQRHCPYCQSIYDMKQDAWVVRSIIV